MTLLTLWQCGRMNLLRKMPALNQAPIYKRLPTHSRASSYLTHRVCSISGRSLRNSDAFVGEIGAYPLKPQTSPWIEWGVGYSLSRSFWGQGLMREALYSVLSHLFSGNLAQRVRADVGPGNERSKHLLKRLGFRLEGLQEAKNFIHGESVDMQLWALSRQRFLAALSEGFKSSI